MNINSTSLFSSILKKIVFVILLLEIGSPLRAQLNMELIGNLDYDQNVNDIWGYAAPDGTEYALVGTQTGVSVVTLADPGNPQELFFVEGTSTTWRDMKTWESTGYAVCDDCPDGLLVMDLSDLPNSMPHYFWNEIPDSTFQSAHNIFIDEFGYGYLCGTNLDGGQTIYFDAFSTPGQPQFIGYGPDEYAHDIYVRDNIMYASEINVGLLSIYDITDKNNDLLLGSTSTPSDFTHNAWLSDDSNYIFTTDERPFASTTSYDVSDFSDIKFLDRFFSEASFGKETIPHNVHALNDYLVISHYTDGVVIVDAQHPDNLIEVGHYDTFEPNSFGFSGCWGAYPFLPSGNILASDRQTGLYVLSANYQRASYLEGKVTDETTGAALNQVEINIIAPDRSTTTDPAGRYKTGTPESGMFDVLFHKRFYTDKIVSTALSNNTITTLDITLEPAVSFALKGRVLDEESGEIIANAKLRFESDFYFYEAETNEDGNYLIPEFYPDEYEVSVSHWGHLTVFQEAESITEDIFITNMSTGYEDLFFHDLGWTVENDSDTTQGAWVREKPIGSLFNSASAPSQFYSPDEDVPEDAGDFAFVTGNDGSTLLGSALLGTSTLTSPPIDMSEWSDPKVSFDHWITSLYGPFVTNLIDGEGYLNFKIDNGRETVLIKQFNMDISEYPSWEMSEFKILDYIAATDEMRFIFEAQSGGLDKSYDEYAIDFFRAWDNNADGSKEQELFEFSVFPNPFRDYFVFEYNFDLIDDAEIRLYDVLGKLLLENDLETTRGRLELGEGLMAGVYFLEIRSGGEKEVITLVRQ